MAAIDERKNGTEPEIKIENLSIQFPDKDGGEPVTALQNVNLEIRQGEFISMVGPSGCGKTTLLRTIADLQQPTSGQILVRGQTPRQIRLQKKFGIVFQSPVLYEWRTVRRNVCMPMELLGMPRKDRTKRVTEMLELVNLMEFGQKYPHELSGGMQQRVGIARALAAEPVLLLSDEATSALDPETTASILELLGDINRRLGLTVVLITHEMSVVRAIADRVAVLAAGQVVEEGPLRRVFATPATEITRRLLAELRPELPAALRARLDEAGPTALLRVAVHGAQARTPLLGELGAALACEPVLLHGGIDHVGSEPVGTLFVGVPAGRGAAAVAFLAPRVTEVEVLGHVGIV